VGASSSAPEGAGPESGGGSTPPADERITALEAEQQRQGGLLDEILTAVRGGGAAGTGPAAVAGTDPAAAGADMAEQMKQAVRDVQAEGDAELGKAVRLGAAGTRPAAESSPREVTVRGKDRLQAAFFGLVSGK
jgi:hypothetical protein